MAVTFRAASAQVAGTTSPLTATLPTGHTLDDLLLLIIAGRNVDPLGTNDTITVAGGSGGWLQHGTTAFFTLAADVEVSLQLWWKNHDGSESNPSVAAGTSLASGTSGWSVQMAAFLGHDLTTPWDVTPVNSDSGIAANTFTPTGITTITSGAMALCLIGLSDNQDPTITTAQSFTADMSGVSYSSSVGADHGMALAHREVASPGAVTQPTWTQASGSDIWLGIATAIRPAGAAPAASLPRRRSFPQLLR